MPAIKLETSEKLDDCIKQNIARKALSICAKALGKPVAVVENIVIVGLTIAFSGACAQPSALVNIAQIGEYVEELRQSLKQSFFTWLAQHGTQVKRTYLHFAGKTRDKWGWILIQDECQGT